VSGRRFGWLPQLPDHRDFRYAARGMTMRSLPTSLDLRPQCPAVLDQGQLGSCTANAISTALEFNQIREGGPRFTPSRLFIYYNERVMIGQEGSDSGAYIRDGFKSIAAMGAAAEGRHTSGSWEYDIDRFTEKPSEAAYNHALNHQAVEYYAVTQSAAQIKSALVERRLVVFGFSVYESFYDVGPTGWVSMPGPRESMVGGHAVTIVGWDDKLRRYIVQNSWGTGWGDGGYMWMPAEYVESPDLADDFWLVETQELGIGGGR
jgi:C1A family cysteine protease